MAKNNLEIIKEYQVKPNWMAYDFDNGKRVFVRPSTSSSQHLTYVTFVSGNPRPNNCVLKSQTPGTPLEDNEERRRVVAKRSLARYLIKDTST